MLVNYLCKLSTLWSVAQVIGLLRTHAGLQHQLLGTGKRRSQDFSKGRSHFVKVRVLTRLSCRVSFCSSLMVILPGIFPLCFPVPS